MLRIIGILFGLLLLLALAGAGAGLYFFYHYGRGLPDYQQLADYEPPTVTRLHAGDGTLIAEYATEKRVFVPVDAIPKRVTNAFISAEDKNFYSHHGVDVEGVFRAVFTDIENLGSNRRPIGGSTITQQVAKNFLLTGEVSFERKAKEAILALRIERSLTKHRILELYLNEIYLGYGSYGVAAAALNYFNKSLDELSIAEAAYLAALPKAPSNYNPTHRKEAAIARRNWVIDRMAEDGYISAADAAAAKNEPLVVRNAEEAPFAHAEYFVEEVRRELLDRYGEKGLYEGGLSVRTTLDPHLQSIADENLRAGLVTYDRRHGWRGPVARVSLAQDWHSQLAGVVPPAGGEPWQLAIVLSVDAKGAQIGLTSGDTGSIPYSELTWARQVLKDQHYGPPPHKPSDVLAAGDIILVEPVTAQEDGTAYPPKTYGLRQIPDVGGAVVALDPHTGRVLAMSGGFSYEESQFNRATQALRQPGSSFKPFVYYAALQYGFTPSTLVLDAPIVIDQGPGLPLWKPVNYGHEFLGPMPMRVGIEKSRNLMTVRLAQTIGMDKVVDVAKKFGVVDDMPEQLSMALGAADVTLLRMTAAYAIFVNGGKKVTPTLIDRAQDRHGKTIFRHDERPCEGCRVGEVPTTFTVPEIPDTREQVADPRIAYQIVSMLEGVVQRGTGQKIKVLGRPLAGKTGTTNDSFDTWFIGFSPDLVVGVYVGFDDPRSLGPKETGASVSVPIFRDIMGEELKGKPAIPFRVPPGILLVRTDPATGLPATPGDKAVILEPFIPGTQPNGPSAVVNGNSVEPASGSSPDSSAAPGGLY
ncbi:MAG: penicillin-binding protein 1A [Alphaproteobacteria bacterium]